MKKNPFSRFPLAGTALLALLLLGPLPASGAWDWPSGGLDPQSLGRGGTTIAIPSGPGAVLGNPAVQPADGEVFFRLDHYDTDDFDGTFVVGMVDGRSKVRGSALYLNEGEAIGLDGAAWGVALAQSLGGSFQVGQAYRTAKLLGEDVSTWDLGFVFTPVGGFTVGYVDRNIAGDSDLLGHHTALGVRLDLPWTLTVAAEVEDLPFSFSGEDTRVGFEVSPLKDFTFRGGFQDIADRPDTLADESATLYTAGVTYSDPNGGTLDLGILWDSETEETVLVIIGLSFGM